MNSPSANQLIDLLRGKAKGQNVGVTSHLFAAAADEIERLNAALAGDKGQGESSQLRCYPGKPASAAPDSPSSKTDFLDDRGFYEVMQEYRHAHVVDQAFVVDRFEAVKRFIRKQLSPEPPAPHSGDHLQRFSAWLAKEMPPGTEIGDPHWWAPRILAAACVTADEAPEPPTGDDLRLAREFISDIWDIISLVETDDDGNATFDADAFERILYSFWSYGGRYKKALKNLDWEPRAALTKPASVIGQERGERIAKAVDEARAAHETTETQPGVCVHGHDYYANGQCPRCAVETAGLEPIRLAGPDSPIIGHREKRPGEASNALKIGDRVRLTIGMHTALPIEGWTVYRVPTRERPSYGLKHDNGGDMTINQEYVVRAESDSAKPEPVFQRKCWKCGKVAPSPTPEGVGVFFCSRACTD